MATHSTIKINRAIQASNCRQCPRLAAFLDDVKTRYPDYHARPVMAFGDDNPKLQIIGLAPGMHGANRTGRPFTGDFAGVLLYQTLHKFGFASHAESISSEDGLTLLDCRITNAVKCLPPANKPTPEEVRRCSQYLECELSEFIEGNGRAILALGTLAHQAVLRSQKLKLKDYVFGHGAVHQLPVGIKLYDSYHCSRYNTQTKRLTAEMFEQVFVKIKADFALSSS